MSKGLKIKVLSRNEEDFTRERKRDTMKVFRNPDPQLHPFERAREYTRALNAVKHDKIFAKPFLYALDAHADGVYSMATLPNSLVYMLSGAGDGEIRLWNLSNRKTVWRAKSHTGIVRGLCSDPYGEHIFSCSSDKTIKMWKIEQDSMGGEDSITPVNSYLGQNSFSMIDHHRAKNLFATSGVQVDIWDPSRSDPVHSFAWGCDSIITVKFNPVETDILVSTAVDRNVVLYDIRSKTPLRKLVMEMSTNAVCWNPMEGFNFTIANEDHNCYTFDMRKLDQALIVHEDHLSAVMCLDYSPTGKEFTTGSYDKSIRIFPVDKGHSREVYTAQRMQRVFSVKYSADNTYVASGSDDANIRLWKAQASKRIANLLPRQIAKENYNEKLKERFQHISELKRIVNDKPLPKVLAKARRLKHTMKVAKKKKEERVRKHVKEGSMGFVNEKSKKIVKVVK